MRCHCALQTTADDNCAVTSLQEVHGFGELEEMCFLAQSWWVALGGCGELEPLLVRTGVRHGVLPGFSKLGYQSAPELLFSSVLPATLVLLTLFADLFILFGEKSFYSSP